MGKILKNLFLPSEENGFCPRIAGSKAAIIYSVLALLLFAAGFPFSNIGISRFLADLTQQLIIEEVNPVRKSYGIMGLEIDEKLSMAAQMKAEDMAKKGYFSHESPSGETPWSWLEKTGYKFAAAGENLAINFPNPKSLVSAWLNSPSHAKNIYNGYFTDVGIGIAKGDAGTIVVMFLAKELNPSVSLSEEPKVLAGSEVIKEKAVKFVPPQETIMKIVQENSAEENALPELSFEKLETDYSRSSDAKIFFYGLFSYRSKIAFTIFLNIIVVWILATFAIKKERFGLRILNSIFFTILALTVWIPDFL
ncbi:MAG: hypothetical protein A2365_01255 [Candidatus Nealsonbacteria bacterium RIFOXYB1_FULL_40_15]|uniref:SCP domain-containing protein n=2 Tax=Candidatus Nealsoniibacteriota TaxID=1817911 RepID=A0A1G2EQ09_9BACT|nr:MAG: hypothetical protein A2365_01255 [Candidatus Nealsonbacteria bacterium RIFOXYB1_FULL_40_15]OGZ27849.1 MAG: hypothetical protein A2427_03990 [Candidatus Nealsonbacteria bacterium RIFOXYC1_FULL_40_7]OGZ28009.1 MAG: hypothetical protein A2562_01335 [Candidatus Nealsonbacteria bacterium RIFOXYD1_FULL_39_11]